MVYVSRGREEVEADNNPKHLETDADQVTLIPTVDPESQFDFYLYGDEDASATENGEEITVTDTSNIWVKVMIKGDIETPTKSGELKIKSDDSDDELRLSIKV